MNGKQLVTDIIMFIIDKLLNCSLCYCCMMISGGRTIIFTETKESASELAGLLPGARALHGDIQQSQRSVIC